MSRPKSPYAAPAFMGRPRLQRRRRYRPEPQAEWHVVTQAFHPSQLRAPDFPGLSEDNLKELGLKPRAVRLPWLCGGI